MTNFIGSLLPALTVCTIVYFAVTSFVIYKKRKKSKTFSAIGAVNNDMIRGNINIMLFEKYLFDSDIKKIVDSFVNKKNVKIRS